MTFSLTVTASSTASQPDTVTITVPAGSTAPTVGSVGFFGNPYSGDTYGVGERISVAVSFNTVVSVVGMPQVALTIGTRTRYATFYYYAEGRHTYFRYRVRPGDADTDGGSIKANALTLNGGSIVAAVDGTTTAVLTHDAVAVNATRKVDGGPVTAPVVTTVRFDTATAPASGTYTKGATIWVEVWFDQAVSVSGSPQLGLEIGSRSSPPRLPSKSTRWTSRSA